ncbi:MAG: hypothetical protein MI867_23740, partial [Pseudomonadales bacterium]|nr:hypothetical protein [Pseudomonadales bacterium]
MKSSEITDVVSCLDTGRTLFYYFKDRYCFDLIQYEIKRLNTPYIAIHDLKQLNSGRFLQKPAVKQAIGILGKNTITAADIELCKPTKQMPFTLTVARWGNGARGHDQTTRNQCNLVLQLNFTNHHKQMFTRLVKPEKYERPFSFFGHPIRQDNKDTLAWARMDV